MLCSLIEIILDCTLMNLRMCELNWYGKLMCEPNCYDKLIIEMSKYLSILLMGLQLSIIDLSESLTTH